MSKHLFLISFSILLILAVLSKTAFAKEENIYLYADNIVADMNEKYIYASGKVYIAMGENSLLTDSVLFDKETNTIYAFNKAVIYGNYFAEGEYLKFNIKSKEGYLSKGQISFLTDDPKKRRFLWGNDIIIKDRETFFIPKGGMSSCDGEKKAWHIEGSDINVELGEYLTSKNTTLYASSLPVLYTPYFLAPIKKEKESGFLIPSFGFSGKNGVLLNLPYYTVINDSRDITNTLIIKTKTSVGVDNQFRYMLSANEKGEMSLTLIDNFDIKKAYVDAKLKHSKEGDTNNLKLDLEYINRKEYFILYPSDSYEKSKPYTRSNGFYEFARNRDLYSGRLFYSQDNTGTFKDFRFFTVAKDGYLNQHGNIGYNYNAKLSAFSYTGEQTVTRGVLEPFFIYRIAGENKGVYTKLKLHVADYLNSSEKKDNQLSGVVQADVGAYLDKALLVNDRYKVVNTFKADASLPYKLDNADIKQFDVTDIENDNKKIKYAFEQKWYDILGLKQPFYLTLWQEYTYYDRTADNFSDIFFLMRISKDMVSFDAAGSYDHKINAFKEINLTGTASQKGFNASANYYLKKGEDEFLNLSLSKKLGYNTKVIAGTRYDIKRRLAREVSFGFEYEKSCYSIKTEYTKKDLPKEDIVMFTVNLFGLGEFKQGY